MNQCLSCSKPCTETSVFCEECRSSLLHRVQYKPTVDQAVQPRVAKTVGGVRIAEEIAQADTLEHEKFTPVLSPTPRRRRGTVPGRRRNVLFALSILFVLTLLLNGVLLFIASHQSPQHNTAVSSSIVKISSTTATSVRATASPDTRTR